VNQPVEADGLPRRFGRYLLFDKIGEGGMARIFLGKSEAGLGAERLAVVKQMLPLLSTSDEFARLLIQEAKLAAELSHGNVVQVFDLGREEQTLYIAMEYVEGFDLRELLRHCSQRKVPIPVEFALFIAIETLRALDYAHRKRDESGQPLGIVHRDVSPSNVLVSFEGEVKLCDFGIARAMGAGAELTEETIQGKAGYMSPEAARGEPLDVRSDLFALGIILWELLGGRRLYRGSEGRPPSLDLARQAEVPPLPLRGYPDENRLHAIIFKALARQRGERFSTAREMLRELEGYVADAGLVASPLRFGQWLMQHFGQEIIEKRRARERAAMALGPTTPPEPAPPSLAAVAHTMREPPAAARKSPLAWFLLALAVLIALAAAAVAAILWIRHRP
jgi:eukaryotic-like serine/threonine-protein kinase